ncbi:MAG: DNA polymerase III subunit delta' [Campylobacterales bacterium]|nr:DNA polymerase III subunit delta' [Campylobacterales bacterium]
MILDDKNRVFISTDIDKCIEHLKQLSFNRFVVFRREDFLIDDAKDVVKEAYITSDDLKYIILAANKFNVYAQNSLLKVLEEPPKNVVFIIITKSKSTLLPTIKSRTQIEVFEKEKIDYSIDFDLKRLDLKNVYEILQRYQHLTKEDAKELVQKIFLNITTLNLKLTEKELDMFSKSIRLLELNSKPINIITQILLTLAIRK